MKNLIETKGAAMIRDAIVAGAVVGVAWWMFGGMA